MQNLYFGNFCANNRYFLIPNYFALVTATFEDKLVPLIVVVTFWIHEYILMLKIEF